MPPERRRALLRQFVRYGLTGALSTATHVAVAVTLIEHLSAGAALANAVASCCAVSISYLINTGWTFSAPSSRRTAIRYLLVSVAAAGMCAVISGLAERQGLHYLAGIAIVVLVVTPTTFVTHRIWTYRDVQPD